MSIVLFFLNTPRPPIPPMKSYNISTSTRNSFSDRPSHLFIKLFSVIHSCYLFINNAISTFLLLLGAECPIMASRPTLQTEKLEQPSHSTFKATITPSLHPPLGRQVSKDRLNALRSNSRNKKKIQVL